MTEDDKTALSVGHNRNKTDEEITDLLTSMSSLSKPVVVNLEVPKQEPKPDPINPKTFPLMVGKTFMRKRPGVFIGATYTVLAFNKERMEFVVQRSCSHFGDSTQIDYTIGCHDFAETVDEVQPKKPSAPVEQEKPKPTKTPWSPNA